MSPSGLSLAVMRIDELEVVFSFVRETGDVLCSLVW